MVFVMSLLFRNILRIYIIKHETIIIMYYLIWQNVAKFNFRTLLRMLIIILRSDIFIREIEV